MLYKVLLSNLARAFWSCWMTILRRSCKVLVLSFASRCFSLTLGASYRDNFYIPIPHRRNFGNVGINLGAWSLLPSDWLWWLGRFWPLTPHRATPLRHRAHLKVHHGVRGCQAIIWGTILTRLVTCNLHRLQKCPVHIVPRSTCWETSSFSPRACIIQQGNHPNQPLMGRCSRERTAPDTCEYIIW